MELDNQRKMLEIAYLVAKQSNDPSTQNGALLINGREDIVGIGINQFPRGVRETAERWQQPLKYKIVEHAERDVLYDATREGVPTEGLTMVCPWAPCTDCARAIIQCGIKKLITHKQAFDRSPEFWKQDIEIALTILQEAGIEHVAYDGKIGAEGVLHSGVLWNP